MSDSGSPFKKQSKEEDVRVHLCGEEHKKTEIKKENAEASSNTIVYTQTQNPSNAMIRIN
jgi:hypothetical protein